MLKLDWLEATEARREFFMATEPIEYKYGKGINERSYIAAPFSEEVTLIRDELNIGFGTNYNVCFLNRYDTQKNQLGWHADDSPSMDLSHPIAVVSFGAEREIWWKEQSYKGEIPPENRRRLQSGSLFIMPLGFQELYYHKIPKCDRECGIRISLTFRRYLY